MRRDYAGVASLFTGDGLMQTSPAVADVLGRDEIRSWLARRQALWADFVQRTRSGAIELDGERAMGRTYFQELMRSCDDSWQLRYGVYHDRYRRTSDGWKFTERRDEVRPRDVASLDGSTRR
jgi:hypothetical protein